MKTWQFFVIVGGLALVAYVTIRTGLGLQAAQTKVESAGNAVGGLLGKLGIKI